MAIGAHLGAKMGQDGAIAPKSAKMRQDNENGRRKGGVIHAVSRDESPCPPLKKQHQRKPGAPPGGSTWNLVELRLEADPGNS